MVTVKEDRIEKTHNVGSKKALNDLIKDIATNTPKAHIDVVTTTYWEYRGWIPVDVWDPVDACPRIYYLKVVLKGLSKADIRVRLQERKDSVLRRAEIYELRDLQKGDRERAEDFLNDRTKRSEQAAAEMRIPTLGSLIERTIAAKKERREIEASYAESALSYHRAWIKRQTQPSEDADRAVKPFVLAELKVNEVSQSHLQEFVDSVARTPNRFGKPNNTKTINNILAVVRSAWNTMHADPELAPFTTRLRFEEQFLRKPKSVTVRPNEVYSDEQVEAIMGATKDEVDAALLGLALMGMRVPGEACGVRWTDLYERDGRTFINVRHQIDHVEGQRVLKLVKTGEKGEKTLYVPPRLKGMILGTKELAERMGSPFVLPGRGGTGDAEGSLSPGSAQEKFERMKRTAGIEGKGKTFYGLRHTVMTKLAQGGDSEAALLAGGWTTTKTMRKHYIKHKAEDLLPAAMEKLPWANVPDALPPTEPESSV